MKKVYIIAALLVTICIPGFSLPLPFTTFSPASLESVRTNLYEVESNGSTILLDGDLTQYDASYSNAVDGMDAKKLSNFSENIGMLRGTSTLAIERRHTIHATDSIFYRMWNMHKLTYQVQFVISLSEPGLSGYLEDNYLNKQTPLDLNSTNNINFTVNTDTASYSPSRFRIIFTTIQAGLLPITYTLLNGYKENSTAVVEWKTANESNMLKYVVEKSADGTHFANAGIVSPDNLAENNYQWQDASPAQGINYYRIQGINENQQVQYSNILKINLGTLSVSMKIAPNPVTGNTIHLGMTNEEPGIYTIKLLNMNGQTMLSRRLNHNGNTATETIYAGPQTLRGMYRLFITSSKGITVTLPVLF